MDSNFHFPNPFNFNQQSSSSSTNEHMQNKQMREKIERICNEINVIYNSVQTSSAIPKNELIQQKKQEIINIKNEYREKLQNRDSRIEQDKLFLADSILNVLEAKNKKQSSKVSILTTSKVRKFQSCKPEKVEKYAQEPQQKRLRGEKSEFQINLTTLNSSDYEKLKTVSKDGYAQEYPFLFVYLKKLEQSDQAEAAFATLKDFFNTIHSLVKKEDKEKYINEGLELFSKLFNNEEISDQEKIKINTFLIFASGNKDLNLKLKENISTSKINSKVKKAMEFLYSFSYKMGEFENFEHVLKKLKQVLSGPIAPILNQGTKLSEEINQFAIKIKSISSTNLKDRFLELIKNIPDQNISEELKNKLIRSYDDLHRLLNDYEFVHPANIGGYASHVDKALKSLNEDMAQLKKLKSKEAKDLVNVMKELTNKTTICLKIAQDIEQKNSALRKAIESFDKTKCLRLLPQELKLLEMLKNLRESDLASKGVLLLEDLNDKMFTADQLFYQLNATYRLTCTKQSGDISFLEETLKNLYESKPIFSDKSPASFKVLGELFKMYRDPQIIWKIQPSFTGALTHTAITNVQENTLSCAEVTGKFSNFEEVFVEGFYGKSLYPDFSKIITDEGYKILSELFPQQSKEKIQQEIYSRYTRHISKLIKTNTKKLEEVIMCSTKKLALSVIPPVKVPFTQEETRSIYKNLQLINEQEMFCSELVSHIFLLCLSQLQAELVQEYATLKKLRSPVDLRKYPLFTEIIPTNMPLNKVHPNKLAQYLQEKGYFKKRELSPLVEMLLETVKK